MAEIIIIGLSELHDRFAAWPDKFRAALSATLEASLYVVWENVPEYPPPPPDSEYIRTGTLGRTLGVSEAGGQSGQPDIFDVKEEGDLMIGEFGTNLEYGPYVIGEWEQARQNAHWWTISVVAERAREKVEALFGVMAEKLAAWLDGQGET